ncbi:MAG: molybdate ABC transporter substrate-binding protein [Bacillota bacterium]|jgi:molybdate transport system substrate-binding protein
MKKWQIILVVFIILVISVFVFNFHKQEETTSLSVAAAANLTKSFSDIGNAFTEETGIPLSFVFGSTGQLTQQIKNGAPVDLFAAADTISIEILAEEKLIDKETIKNYALGNIVLVPYDQGDYLAKSLADLTHPQIKIIALANPETAPYGKAAQELLQTAGIWDEVKEKIVFGKNIDEVLTYVKTGNADAALVAKSLVYQTETKYYEDQSWLSLYRPIVQALGVMENSKNKDAAIRFAQFILSKKGQKILQDYGYETP